MSKQNQSVKKEKKPLSNYSLLMIIIAGVYLMSFLIPSGEFARVDGKVDPSSFQLIPKVFVPIHQFFLQMPKTVLSSQGGTIIAMLVVSGAIGVVTDSGALDMAIYALTKKFKNAVLVVIPLIFAYFGFLGTVGVMVVLPFVPLAISLARRLKVDNVFAVAVMMLGAYSGFMSSPISPFTTGIAQEIAGIPTFSGAGFRTFITVFLLAFMAGYMCWYAYRVRKDPKNSVMENIDYSEFGELEDFEGKHMSKRQTVCLCTFFGGFLLFSFCSAKYQFGVSQLAGIMLPTAIFEGIVMGWDLDTIMKSFIKGGQRQVAPIVVVILASAVPTILNMSGILDSIVYYISLVLRNFNSVFAAIGMFISNAVINFAIPSGSGQAVAVMPIMAPLSDLLGVSRQVSVLAFQFGDGFTNLLNPTNAALIGSLAAAGATMKHWIKLIFPLYCMVFVICSVFLAAGVMMGW